MVLSLYAMLSWAAILSAIIHLRISQLNDILYHDCYLHPLMPDLADEKPTAVEPAPDANSLHHAINAKGITSNHEGGTAVTGGGTTATDDTTATGKMQLERVGPFSAVVETVESYLVHHDRNGAAREKPITIDRHTEKKVSGQRTIDHEYNDQDCSGWSSRWGKDSPLAASNAEFDCATEFPEHHLVRRWIAPEATGTTNTRYHFTMIPVSYHGILLRSRCKILNFENNVFRQRLYHSIIILLLFYYYSIIILILLFRRIRTWRTIRNYNM